VGEPRAGSLGLPNPDVLLYPIKSCTVNQRAEVGFFLRRITYPHWYSFFDHLRRFEDVPPLVALSHADALTARRVLSNVSSVSDLKKTVARTFILAAVQ
jgi:hypothetical protein